MLRGVLLAAIAIGRARMAGADDAPAPAPAGPAVNDADRVAAMALVREGNRRLDAHDPAGALDKFREAHHRVGGDKLRFNLGQALAALPGHELEAYREFERYLDRVPGATPELVKVARDEMQRLRRNLGFLRFDILPSGAAIGIDDENAGYAPLPRGVVVAPGGHSLHVNAAGFVAYGESISINRGQERDFLIRLAASFPSSPVAGGGIGTQPSSSGSPAGFARGAPGPVGSVSAVDQTGPSGAEPPGRTPFYRRWWFWAGVGAVAIAGVSAGVALSSGGGVSRPCPPEIAPSRCYGAP